LASATISGGSFARAFSTREATSEAAAAARKRVRAAGREGGAAVNWKGGEEERELQNCSNGGGCCSWTREVRRVCVFCWLVSERLRE
jgi:general stress protein YciG